MFGKLSPTLVTEPIPAPVADHVPSPRRKFADEGVPVPRRATSTIPLVTFVPATFGTPLRLIVGVDVAFEIVIVSPLTELFATTLVTVPAPARVAHVPSPRQKVSEDAFDPELRFATDRFPLTSVASEIDACVLNTP